MNGIKQYIVDAFADNVFEGNPAAVCILNHWPEDHLLQNIAIENNLSETAYVSQSDDYKSLRWFTPGGEIDLCGHATLATAFVLFNFYDKKDSLLFETQSGHLTVEQHDDLYKMTFPSFNMKKVEISDALKDALGVEPLEVYIGRDMVVVVENEDIVRNFEANLDKIKTLDGLLFHITAPSKDYDCVSRTFAPKLGIPEDPVCGSGHCHLVPLWAQKLEKEDIIAYQASNRGGTLFCTYNDDYVEIAGNAQLFSSATLNI